MELFKGICIQLLAILLEHKDPDGLLELQGTPLVELKKSPQDIMIYAVVYNTTTPSILLSAPIVTAFQSHFITHINLLGFQYRYLLLTGSQSSQADFITSINHLSC